MWNVFYEDARKAINECFFKEVVFADDLNAYKVFTQETSNKKIVENMRNSYTYVI